MVGNGKGSIVNVSSVTDLQPIANLSAYIASKGGIVSLTRALALEFAPQGIRVNAVAPGAVDTELNADVYTDEVRANYRSRIPVGRIADADDIAGAVVFLLSDSSRYVTGVELLVDGGLVLNGNVGHRVN
jgi:3-oxoacyl-[acyl-carrier protein] reductase